MDSISITGTVVGLIGHSITAIQTCPRLRLQIPDSRPFNEFNAHQMLCDKTSTCSNPTAPLAGSVSSFERPIWCDYDGGISVGVELVSTDWTISFLVWDWVKRPTWARVRFGQNGNICGMNRKRRYFVQVLVVNRMRLCYYFRYFKRT
jgi:hypothetical protein